MAEEIANEAVRSDESVIEQGLQNEAASSDEGHNKESETPDWENDPHNPWNWSGGKKAIQIVMLSSVAILSTIATSIISPAVPQLMAEFNVSRTVAILPLTFSVLALGFGPIVAGPMSETLGRYPLYLGGVPLGALFTLGAGFTHNFGALCFLRFMATLCWGPVLAVAAGSLSDLFRPWQRGLPTAIFITMPFLGPGLGPIIGSFATVEKGWRWTQWTLLFFAILSIVLTLFAHETFHPVLKKRLARKRGESVPPPPPFAARMKVFAVVALVRLLRMLAFEPIVTFICLYVAVEFGTLFSFFASVPFVFETVYDFSIEQAGLVFVAILAGCVLGLSTIIACDVLIYRKQFARYPNKMVPPEYRLFPAMFGSIGLPLGLFWFGWTARSSVSWASPAVAILPFSWGNLCVFITTMQYITDTYSGNVVASAASANSLARYGFAAVFPLFTIQMYQRLGIHWASSLLGFISLGLLPIPWVLFKFGAKIRAKSQYETNKYES